MMTPQQLMDLPHAGMAERQLRKDGRWELTPHERIAKNMDDLSMAIDDAQSAVYNIEKDLNT